MIDHRALIAILLIVFSGIAYGGTPALVCDDVSFVPETPAVDYFADIQPLFDDLNCTGCHGGAGSLFLNAEQSFAQLRCEPAQSGDIPPDAQRVVPHDPNASWLYLRVACDDPNDLGFRMPQFDNTVLTSSELRLIFDWISQGAYMSDDIAFRTGFEFPCDE